MNTRLRTPLAGLLLCLTPVPALAQETGHELDRRTVRVWLEGTRHEGVVRATGPDGLVLDSGGRTDRFGWSEIDHIALRSTRRLTGRVALGMGLGAGLLIGTIAEELESCLLEVECDDRFHAAVFMRGFAGAGVVGAAVGALLGSMFTRESWTPVAMPAPRMAPGAWRIGLSVPAG